MIFSYYLILNTLFDKIANFKVTFFYFMNCLSKKFRNCVEIKIIISKSLKYIN